MQRLALFFVLSWALGTSAWGSALDDVFAAVQRIYPASQITGSFWDWRAPSVYRRRAGLHYGYDLSAPAGTPVTAPWEAAVVAITPWNGRECGITLSAGGHRITFGHLLPSVEVGWHLKVGQCIGLVARDHVDIKAKDERDHFVDLRLVSVFSVPTPRPCLARRLTPVVQANPDDLERRRLVEEGVLTADEDSSGSSP